jgi:hypothetical protein
MIIPYFSLKARGREFFAFDDSLFRIDERNRSCSGVVETGECQP